MADYSLQAAEDQTAFHTSTPLVEDGEKSTAQPQPEPKVPVKPADCWSYFTADPMERWPFLLHWVVSIFAVVMLIICGITIGQKANVSTSFIILGVVEVGIFLWAARQFHLLLALREQVNKYAGLNRQFKKENVELRQYVDKLGKASEELRDTENRLKVVNERMEQNVKKFSTLQDNLQKMGQSNIEGMQQLAAKAEQMSGSWRDSLIKNEKGLFMKIFDEMEMKDGEADMSKEEFDRMLAALPDDYALLFKRMSKDWETISGDDGMMQFEEFVKVVDEVVEERVKDKMLAEE